MSAQQTTKNLLAESLKELSRFKPVDKITIKELTKNCGLTSPTFYNHFRDKYDLMAWIYNQKVEASLENFGRGDSLEDVICKWLEIILEDEDFYVNLPRTPSDKILSDTPRTTTRLICSASG